MRREFKHPQCTQGYATKVDCPQCRKTKSVRVYVEPYVDKKELHILTHLVCDECRYRFRETFKKEL